MKKKISLVVVAMLVLSCFAGCGKKEGKTFTIGFDAEFPPYGYVDDNGEYVGFDLDLAAEVAKRNDWTLKLQAINWNSKDMELSTGTIDCIWNGFTMSEDRVDAYTWSDPYVENTQVVVVKSDSGITSLADLAGEKVGVQEASSALEALQSDDSAALLASFDELVQVADYNTAFMYLESGAVDAVALDIGVAKYQIEQRGDAYMMLDETIISELYGIGFLLGNEKLRDQVQASMDEMSADGTLATIAEKWGLSDCVIIKDAK